MAQASCSIEDSEAKMRAAFGRLKVEPGTAEKTIKLLRFINDSGISLNDAREALKLATTARFASLPAALLSETSAAADSKGSKFIAMGANEISISLNMAKLGSMTPVRLTATMVFMVAQKGLAAAGVVDQNEANKCREAMAKLTVDVGITALTWETGIGAILGVSGAALDAYDAWNSCRMAN